MNWSFPALALALGVLAVALPAHATPPCTCDPLPCWLTLSDGSGSSDCSIVTVPPAPGVPGVPAAPGLPNPPPCTCDPYPLPISVVLP